MRICIASISLPLSVIRWTGTLRVELGTLGDWIERIRSASVVSMERSLAQLDIPTPAAGVSFFSLQDVGGLALTLSAGDVLLVVCSSDQDKNRWPVQVWHFVEGTSQR